MDPQTLEGPLANSIIDILTCPKPDRDPTPEKQGKDQERPAAAKAAVEARRPRTPREDFIWLSQRPWAHRLLFLLFGNPLPLAQMPIAPLHELIVAYPGTAEIQQAKTWEARST